MAARNHPGIPAVERESLVTRVFNAPRALVFKAWTDAAHVAQWWGPHQFTNPVCEVDARPGGALRIVMRGPDGVDYPMSGIFREVEEPERLVIVELVEDGDRNTIIEAITTVTFADEDGKTRVTVHTAALGMTAESVRMLDGMQEGWTQSLERLEAFLSR